MRISDWSSDVCSSDLKTAFFFELARKVAADLAATPISEDELQRTVGPLAQYVLRASTGNQFWMQQLGGATNDPRRIAAARAIVGDLKAVTPATLQATAAKYLRPDKDWTMEVVHVKVAAAMKGAQSADAG